MAWSRAAPSSAAAETGRRRVAVTCLYGADDEGKRSTCELEITGGLLRAGVPLMDQEDILELPLSTRAPLERLEGRGVKVRA